jgi:hypothetical protein
MSKQRLDEATIRRQLELAGKPELFESYKKKLQEQEELEEETVEEVKTDEQSRGGEGTDRLDEEEEEIEAEEVPGEEPAPEMDVEPEPEMDDEMGGEMDEGDVEGLVSVIAQAITDHTGIPVDVEGEEEAPEMDAEPAMDEVPAEEPEMDMGGEEDELMEDAAQEAARGMPKPGSADHIDDGSLEGVTDSSEKVDHAHSDHKMKDQPTTSKSLQERRVRALAERVYRRVVRKIQEAKKVEQRKQKIQEARKRIAARRAAQQKRSAK